MPSWFTLSRATKDLDIFIRCDAENARAVRRALVEFGAPIADVTDAPTQGKDE